MTTVCRHLLPDRSVQPEGRVGAADAQTERGEKYAVDSTVEEGK